MSKKSLLGIGVLLAAAIASGIFFNKDMLPDWMVLPGEYSDTFECAENGNPICQRDIAIIFEGDDHRSGIAMAGNTFAPFRAHKWFLNAALQGDKYSMRKYGWFLCHNLWNDPNHEYKPVEGLAWLLLSYDLDSNKLLNKDGNHFDIYFIAPKSCVDYIATHMPDTSFDEYISSVEKRARELAQEVREPDNFIWDDRR